MTPSELIILLIPTWLLFTTAAIAAAYRWYIALRFDVSVISRWEQALYAIAMTNLTLFYLGIWQGLGHPDDRIAMSRLVWLWVIVISIYISYKMAKRHGADGLE